eukprot:227912-Chlamydomonas_euryale.AAC.1
MSYVALPAPDWSPVVKAASAGPSGTPSSVQIQSAFGDGGAAAVAGAPSGAAAASATEADDAVDAGLPEARLVPSLPAPPLLGVPFCEPPC